MAKRSMKDPETGETLKLKSFFEWIVEAGKDPLYAEVARWVNVEGQPVDPFRDVSQVARVKHKPDTYRKVAASTDEFVDISQARTDLAEIMVRLPDKDSERIAERLDREYPDQGIGVSLRDTQDIDGETEALARRRELEALKRATPPTTEAALIEALQVAGAIDNRRIDPREM